MPVCLWNCCNRGSVKIWEKKEGAILMIVLTKLRGERFTLNCDLIETITENPDTTILLTNGSLHIVKEPMQEVIDKTVEFRRRIYRDNISM
jgi:flagellar protein FlbD